LFLKEDIIYLNITNELHHLCLKRSIQVLRLNNFNPTCIKRRPSSDDQNDINEIMYWSNHRVMEWLRSIDLSEYAPNLRGSGVCGALIVRIIIHFSLHQGFLEGQIFTFEKVNPIAGGSSFPPWIRYCLTYIYTIGSCHY
jgi:hypothetical protein